MAHVVPRQKLWLERNGRIAFSDYRVGLLERIGELGSLAAAAESLGLSYRRAWGKIKELEANLGVRLVVSEVGGPGGGHTRLTPLGQDFVAAYRRFQRRLEVALGEAFAAELEPLLATGLAEH